MTKRKGNKEKDKYFKPQLKKLFTEPRFKKEGEFSGTVQASAGCVSCASCGGAIGGGSCATCGSCGCE